MTCITRFSIDDGTLVANVSVAAIGDTFDIARTPIEDGIDRFRAADGSGKSHFRFEATRYTITGAGPADPKLWALAIQADTWTVTIPGFADGGADEIWTVLPARPTQTRTWLGRRAGHSWSLALESA